MTLMPRKGDRVRITMTGAVTEVIDNSMLVQPDHLPHGMVADVQIDCNLPITEILARAALEPEDLVAGDRVSDMEDDWGIVVFNDTVGEQLLVAYDRMYGRKLLPYEDVRITRRPADEYAIAPHNPAPMAGDVEPHAELKAGFLKEAMSLGLDEVAATDAWNDPVAKPFSQLEAESKARAEQLTPWTWADEAPARGKPTINNVRWVR